MISPPPPFSLNAPGVVHLQGPNHRVRGVSVRELWLRQRPEEVEGVRVGERRVLHCVCLCVRARLSWCTDLNWHMKVSRLLGRRADGKLLSATALWSPESPAFNFAAIQPPSKSMSGLICRLLIFSSARCTKQNSCQISGTSRLFFPNPDSCFCSCVWGPLCIVSRQNLPVLPNPFL